MDYALLDHRGDSLGANGGTTGTINASGADLVVVGVGYYNGSHTLVAADISDSSGTNTYQELTGQTTGTSEYATRFFYCQGGTFASGFSVTVTATGVYVAAAIAAFSGSVASPADQENGAAVGALSTSIQPGTVTPSEDNELIVQACSAAAISTLTCDTDTILDAIGAVGGTSYPIALAYQIQTSATADNPTWGGFFGAASAVAATFKNSGGGGGGQPLFVVSNLSGLQAGGPFFVNPLG